MKISSTLLAIALWTLLSSTIHAAPLKSEESNNALRVPLNNIDKNNSVPEPKNDLVKAIIGTWLLRNQNTEIYFSIHGKRSINPQNSRFPADRIDAGLLDDKRRCYETTLSR
ncbi:MAG: hypothetical protein V2B20_17615 [Pseudomonadota bacterium]